MQWHEHATLTEYVLNAHQEQQSLSAPPRLLDGHDLIKEFGLQPGPEIGEVLEILQETQAAGEVTTRQEAIDFVKRFFKDNPRKHSDMTRHKEQ